MKGKLYGIGVGPGDSELMTVKAARIVGEADIIITPKTEKKDGSVALNIASPYIQEHTEIVPVVFPMVLDDATQAEGWEEAKKILIEDTADLLILDELNIVLATGMLPLEEVIDFLKKYKGKTEIITTGRGAPEELIDIADLVTDMQEIKHYFHKGVSSRDGIDH